jgi:hypothetical protein
VQVVGVSKLKAKYESHEAKRQLCNSYDMFAADERILPSLPKLLGAGAAQRSGAGPGDCLCCAWQGTNHLAGEINQEQEHSG